MFVTVNDETGEFVAKQDIVRVMPALSGDGSLVILRDESEMVESPLSCSEVAARAQA